MMRFGNCKAVYRSYPAASPADKVSSADFNAKGNTAFQAKNFSEAIEHYTSAINIDGANHMYYHNRSFAYSLKGDDLNALEDANSCIGLKPKFAKGYSRKGAALHELKRYNDSISAYEAGLVECPGDKGISSGLDSVKKQKDAPAYSSAPAGGMGMGGGPMGGGGLGMPGMGSLFGPDMLAKIALDPKLRGYLDDPEFMTKIKSLQADPNKLGTMIGDPKIMAVFQAMLGMNGMAMDKNDDDEDANSPMSSTTTQHPTTHPNPWKLKRSNRMMTLSNSTRRRNESS